MLGVITALCVYKNSSYILEIYTNILICEICQKFALMYSSKKQNNTIKEFKKLKGSGEKEIKLIKC